MILVLGHVSVTNCCRFVKGYNCGWISVWEMGLNFRFQVGWEVEAVSYGKRRGSYVGWRRWPTVRWKGRGLLMANGREWGRLVARFKEGRSGVGK